MKQLCYTILLALAASIAGYAQTPDEPLEKGIPLYDSGDYQGALVQYQQALKADPKNPAANYEMSLTYFALQDMPQTIRYSDAVIKSRNASPGIKAQALVNKGSALDIMGKPELAIKQYLEAIKLDPAYQMAYYNLGLTHFNQKNYTLAEQALTEAVQLKPGHGSSHLLLAHTKQQQGQRVQSLLALYNFLLLEPDTERAAAAFEQLRQMQQQGVKTEGGNKTTITVSPDKLEDNPFSAADLMVSMLQATNTAEAKAGKSPEAIFSNNTASFFRVLGEVGQKESGFWWNFYADFFQDMEQQQHVEAFAYYINPSEAARQWVAAHPEKIDALASWYQSYKR